MKKFSVFLAILYFSLCLSLAFISCDDGSTGGSGSSSGGGVGTLTITDLPAEYNGLYAKYQGGYWEGGIIEGYDASDGEIETLSKISNGKVTMKTWYNTAHTATGLERFYGNVTVPAYSNALVVCNILNFTNIIPEFPLAKAHRTKVRRRRVHIR